MRTKLACGFLSFLLLAGCASANKPGPDFKGYVPTFSVTGDVDNVFVMNRESAAQFTWARIQDDGFTLPAVLLEDVVKAASPRANEYSLLLVGVDGLASMISGDDLTACHIAYSDGYAWQCINFNHPISSKIKMLHEIVVVSGEEAEAPASTGLVDAASSRYVSAGRLRLSPHQAGLNFEGRSEINGRAVTVYTPYRRVPLGSLMDAQGTICFVGRDGSMLYERSAVAAYLEISGNTVRYKDMRDVAGVMADAPMINVSEVYRDALYLLERGERVLIVELDGWGWEMYSRAHQPYLGGLGAMKAMAVFPPLSPVGLASMLSGELPVVHGIHDRSTREGASEDIFAKAVAMGRKAIYIEGSTSLIRTSLTPVLSPDLNGLNGTDDEVYDNAKNAMAENPGLLFVHFHGIDDAATAYGPYAPETLAKITYIDSLVADLAAGWYGRIIITADHGLHLTPEGISAGDHGVFCAEDMLVPYIMTTGGR
jgi:hypothetical protein